MDLIPYKDYLIQPAPMRLDEGGWNMDLHIWTADRSHSRKYSTGDVWPTEEDAIQHIVNFGRQIIDGETPDLTPP